MGVSSPSWWVCQDGWENRGQRRCKGIPGLGGNLASVMSKFLSNLRASNSRRSFLFQLLCQLWWSAALQTTSTPQLLMWWKLISWPNSPMQALAAVFLWAVTQAPGSFHLMIPLSLQPLNSLPDPLHMARQWGKGKSGGLHGRFL